MKTNNRGSGNSDHLIPSLVAVMLNIKPKALLVWVSSGFSDGDFKLNSSKN